MNSLLTNCHSCFLRKMEGHLSRQHCSVMTLLPKTTYSRRHENGTCRLRQYCQMPPACRISQPPTRNICCATVLPEVTARWMTYVTDSKRNKAKLSKGRKTFSSSGSRSHYECWIPIPILLSGKWINAPHIQAFLFIYQKECASHFCFLWFMGTWRTSKIVKYVCNYASEYLR